MTNSTMQEITVTLPSLIVDKLSQDMQTIRNASKTTEKLIITVFEQQDLRSFKSARCIFWGTAGGF